MPTRILPAVGDADAVRSLTTLLSQLPDAEPVTPVSDSTQLVDTLARLAAESVDELPEVVVVHERIGPVPALELVREVALRFPRSASSWSPPTSDPVSSPPPWTPAPAAWSPSR